MLRILRPGGLLICIEPNNLWNYLTFTSLTEHEPVETLVRRFEFWLRIHRGRIVAGQGNHSIGDLLPGLFTKLGLHEINVWQADRPAPLYPPYDAPAQKALIDQEQQWHDSATGPWDRESLHRLFALGGGSDASFDQAFADVVEKFHGEQHAIAMGSFHSAGGGINYLVSARRPA